MARREKSCATRVVSQVVKPSEIMSSPVKKKAESRSLRANLPSDTLSRSSARYLLRRAEVPCGTERVTLLPSVFAESSPFMPLQPYAYACSRLFLRFLFFFCCSRMRSVVRLCFIPAVARTMSTTAAMRPPVPPFSYDDAVKKVRAAEDGWNSRNPAKVKMAYTEDSKWRNRARRSLITLCVRLYV